VAFLCTGYIEQPTRKQVIIMTASLPTYPDLKGKVALITGIGQVGIPNSSTWGNGAATARVLSHNGVKIFGCDINVDAAGYTKQRLLEDNPKADVDIAKTDVSSSDDVRKLVEAVLEKHGRIDILINNVSRLAELCLWSYGCADLLVTGRHDSTRGSRQHVRIHLAQADRSQPQQRIPALP
jgi:NAD(P)-dependent dehydrogenase (short-subunit alcohol dehydrogenase family)